MTRVRRAQTVHVPELVVPAVTTHVAPLGHCWFCTQVESAPLVHVSLVVHVAAVACVQFVAVVQLCSWQVPLVQT